MKKLIVIVSFLVLSASLFSQDKPYFSVPNKTSMFTKSLPVRQLVLLSDSGWLFQLTHGVTNWQTVAYVISNHWYRNVITDGVGNFDLRILNPDLSLTGGCHGASKNRPGRANNLPGPLGLQIDQRRGERPHRPLAQQPLTQYPCG